MSGFSGLVYEITWMRMLAQVFGSTMTAVTTVLCVFMGGLALGSVWLGRRADRWDADAAMRGYALIQLGIAASAMLVPTLFHAAQASYVWFYRAASPSTHALAVVRIGVSALILAVPSILMGGALPAICRYAARRWDTFGKSAGGLYAVNTAGGVAGCAVAGFGMIELAGLSATSYYAAAINAVTGIIAYQISRGTGAAAAWSPAVRRTANWESNRDTAEGRCAPSPEPSPGQMAAIMAVATVGASGFVALGCEVLWTRVFAFFLGSTVYTFAIILMTCLVGIALGAHLFGRLADRVRDLGLLLGMVQCCIGVLVLLSAPILCAVFRGLAPATVPFQGASLAPLHHGLAAAAAGLFLPTLLMGGTLPIAMKWYRAWRRTAGRTVGAVVGANTLGATLGPAVAGFVLIPCLGVYRSFVALVALNFLFGLALLAQAQVRSRRAASLAIAVIAIAGTGPLWVADPVRQYMADRTLGKVLAIREGHDSTITISHYANKPLLTIDGTPMASTCRGMRLRAHLPMLLHDRPRDVLVIGFGTGTTAGIVATRYPNTRVDCVEVSPTVVGSADYFREANHNVRQNPRVNVIVEDARNYVSCTDKSYDVIIADAPHPFASMASALYNREFYHACRERLAQDGVFLQWIPLYLEPAYELKAMVRTFVHVFPKCTIWGGDDINLIAVRGPLRISMGRLKSRLADPAVRADLEDKAYPTVAKFLGCLFLMGQPGPRLWVGDGPIITDDKPFIEFSIPRHFRDDTPRGRAVQWPEIAAHRTPATPYLVP